MSTAQQSAHAIRNSLPGPPLVVTVAAVCAWMLLRATRTGAVVRRAPAVAGALALALGVLAAGTAWGAVHFAVRGEEWFRRQPDTIQPADYEEVQVVWATTAALERIPPWRFWRRPSRRSPRSCCSRCAPALRRVRPRTPLRATPRRPPRAPEPSPCQAAG